MIQSISNIITNSSSEVYKSQKRTFKIKIQSVSDIITNSSSELFCQITGDNLDTINEFLSEIIKGTDSEFDPTIYYDGDCINIDIPYGYSEIAIEFMKAGLKAILSDYKNINLNFDVEY